MTELTTARLSVIIYKSSMRKNCFTFEICEMPRSRMTETTEV